MLRQTFSSSPTGSQSPLTRAQLKAAIDAEERRQGLTPDSLIAESTLEEEAKRLGLSPEKLREAARQAAVPPSRAVYASRNSSLWTLQNRRLFTLGMVVALTVTGIEAISRSNILPWAQRISQAWVSKQPQRYMAPSRYVARKILPIDAHFKERLAQTIGPNPTLRMVIKNESNGSILGQENEEFFPLDGVPDGYEVYAQESGQYQMSYGATGSPLVTFQRADPISETIPAQQRTEAVNSWRFVRYGGRWYARAWVTRSELQAFLQGSPDRLYMPVRVATSTAPSATEILIPATSIDTRWNFNSSSTSNELTRTYYANLPKDFKVDPALVAATKNRGEFRAVLPVQNPNESYNQELAFFKAASFSASSNLVSVSRLKEGIPFSVPSIMLPLLANRGYYDKAIRKIDMRPEVTGTWNLVRYGDILYVRGWIAGPVRKEALSGKNLLVSSSPRNPQTGYQPTPVTLPLTNLVGSSAPENDGATATFTRVILDKHAWEKW